MDRHDAEAGAGEDDAEIADEVGGEEKDVICDAEMSARGLVGVEAGLTW